MPTLKAGVSDPINFFNLNGVDYQKGGWALYYSNYQTDSSGNVKENLIQVGIKYLEEPDLVLQHPEKVNDWKDGTGTKYTDLQDLLDDIDSLMVLGPVSGGGSGSNDAADINTDNSSWETIEGDNVQANLDSLDTLILNARSTGVRTGGDLSDQGSGVVRITAGAGGILDNTTPATPDYTSVTWSQTDLDLSVADNVYFIYVDNTGTVTSNTTEPTAANYRTRIYLWRVSVRSGVVSGTTSIVQPLQQYGPQIRDIWDALGFVKKGMAISAAGTDLTLAKAAGSVYTPGSNFYTSALSPHELTIASESPVTFRMITQDGTQSADTTTLDVGNYDVSNTITAIPGSGTRATIFEWRYFPGSGNHRVFYGQSFFNGVEDAYQALQSGTYKAVVPASYDNSIILGWVIATKAATNLADGVQTFVTSNKFGLVGGSIASVGTGPFMTDLSDDLTPTLGGNLDGGNNNISNLSNLSVGDGVGTSANLSTNTLSFNRTDGTSYISQTGSNTLAFQTDNLAGNSANRMQITGGSDQANIQVSSSKVLLATNTSGFSTNDRDVSFVGNGFSSRNAGNTVGIRNNIGTGNDVGFMGDNLNFKHYSGSDFTGTESSVFRIYQDRLVTYRPFVLYGQNTSQINSLSPDDGALIYNSQTDRYAVRADGAWVYLAKVPQLQSLTSSRDIASTDVMNTVNCTTSSTLTITSTFSAMAVGDTFNYIVQGVTLTFTGASGVTVNGTSAGSVIRGNDSSYLQGVVTKVGTNSYVIS